jgi:hypothetical protein
MNDELLVMQGYALADNLRMTGAFNTDALVCRLAARVAELGSELDKVKYYAEAMRDVIQVSAHPAACRLAADEYDRVVIRGEKP